MFNKHRLWEQNLMNCKNKLVGDLLKKDKNISQNAANEIINNTDLDAWVYLVENFDYILDFIKRNATQKLFMACNERNISNLFDFLDYHSPDLDEFVASAFAEFCNDEIMDAMTEFLKNGTKQQKAYAAKFFAIVAKPEMSELLFEASKSDYSPLADNCALALSNLQDQKSYEYYLDFLTDEDDWKVLSAARFLNLYGDKKAILPMLQAMHKSPMSENIAGEIASLEKLFLLFKNKNPEIQALSFECFDNILSGLIQIWSLNALFSFEVKTCIETLLEILHSESPFKNQCAQLLLKAKNRLELYNSNDEYQYDEDKNTLQELDEICGLLNSYSESFWEAQIDLLFDELDNESSKRKIAALNLISDMKIDYAAEELVKKLNTEDEKMLCEIIITLSNINGISQIPDKDEILSKIQNTTLKAIVENIFLTAV